MLNEPDQFGFECDDEDRVCSVDYDGDLSDKGSVPSIIEIKVPDPESRCAQASVAHPEWEILNVKYTSQVYSESDRQGRHPPPVDALSTGYLEAEFYFHSTDLHYWCFMNSYGLGPINPPKYTQVGWFPCVGFPARNEQPDLTPVQFLFNATTYEFTVQQNWTCIDAPRSR
jgi:hypothetical protein